MDDDSIFQRRDGCWPCTDTNPATNCCRGDGRLVGLREERGSSPHHRKAGVWPLLNTIGFGLVYVKREEEQRKEIVVVAAVAAAAVDWTRP